MATDNSQTPEPLTTEHAAQLRALCEQQVLALLVALCDRTGLDLRHVEVHCVAASNPALRMLRLERDAPQVIPVAVRIDLTI